MRAGALENQTALSAQWRTPILLVAISILQLVYSLPNVIALRTFLTVLTFSLVFPELIAAVRQARPSVKYVLLLFGLLLAWTIVVAVFISDRPNTSIDEWTGEWLPAALAFLGGVGVFSVLGKSNLKKKNLLFWAMLLIPLSLLMVSQLLSILFEYMRIGFIPPHFSGFSDHKANVTYAACALLPIVFAFAILRVEATERYLNGSMIMVLAVGALAIGAVITSGTRNGVIVTALGVVVAGIALVVKANMLGRSRSLRVFVVAALTFIVMVVAWAGANWDARWQRFTQTIPIALDTDGNRQWLEPAGTPLPATADGGQAEESAYQRIAWAKIGFGLLLEHPWGLEISRSTFRELVIERYGMGSMAHAHNSVIDFGLNAGFPGLALWFAFVSCMLISGWLVAISNQSVAGWALVFLVLMYIARSMIDSIMRDHILEQFMLTAGIFLGAVAHRDWKNN